MQNSIIAAENMCNYCLECPLLGGFMQGEQPGLAECYYYDFDLPDKYLSPWDEKERIDQHVKYYGVPEIPDR